MPLSHIWLSLGEYDESYYLTHFIFGLCPEVMRGVYIQQPESLLAPKNMAEKIGIDSSDDIRASKAYYKEKDEQSSAA